MRYTRYTRSFLFAILSAFSLGAQAGIYDPAVYPPVDNPLVYEAPLDENATWELDSACTRATERRAADMKRHLAAYVSDAKAQAAHVAAGKGSLYSLRHQHLIPREWKKYEELSARLAEAARLRWWPFISRSWMSQQPLWKKVSQARINYMFWGNKFPPADAVFFAVTDAAGSCVRCAYYVPRTGELQVNGMVMMCTAPTYYEYAGDIIIWR